MTRPPWKFYAIAFTGAFFGGFVQFLVYTDLDVNASVTLFTGTLLVSMTTFVMMDTAKNLLDERMA